ncbi:hypothetical protein M433DRAFT_336119 [Acidomyces richmondensis BFW]|nr:MAG: hypothetical protein FE78DRAFT_477462 [Acidomyces sp. 'richmondensis']KYG43755.1 hypothetical protein M433DRAFT_336119 [Acidomyces richmondensis BFW]
MRLTRAWQAVYSGVSVYEMEIQGVACMRRRSDGWLNATQILKVAGVDKGKRTKVLEKEILTGEHEKVQGGYGKYQGTWISYKRGREFCRQYGVEDILRPLLDYDVSADGSGGRGQETPTKEQAMAANRKRFYNTGFDSRQQGPISNGTFFQNISPTTSVALAAMNKAARLNSPQPRPPSAPMAPNMRRPSQSDVFPGGSQQSVMSDASVNTDGKYDSAYATQPNGTEPPRKRIRRESQDGMAPPALPLDVSMRSVTPTEPNESFLYDGGFSQELANANGEPVTLPPLPTPSTDEQQEKINMILDLFADAGRTDYASHDALIKLSGEDFNLPLDASANNALHWAATLGKVSLLKLLIQKGANMWRGNAAGQSPLISAVLVNNCWEHSCFPELLEVFGPLIEVRDAQGRTILHHISVSSGIKGRAPSSKYYLEALLEYLVRMGTQSNGSTGPSGAAANIAAAATANMQGRVNGESLSQDSQALVPAQKSGVSLVRFISHVVNARDKAGNTALNLVARIGNRSIIQQLIEIHADPSLPNYKGVSAKDFGVGVELGEQPYLNGQIGSQKAMPPLPDTQSMKTSDAGPLPEGTSASQVEDLSQDVIASMTTMLTQNLASHKELLKVRTEQIDRLNDQIREFSALQKADLAKLQELKERVKMRAERQAKIANLKRAIIEQKAAKQQNDQQTPPKVDLEPSWLDESSEEILKFETADGAPNGLQKQFLESKVPSTKALRARLNAYLTNNSQLQNQADELRSRSIALEGMYRKVVSLCTGVAEEKVEENLPALVAAVESERGGLGEQEVGRVREFLRRVDCAGGSGAVEG